MTDTRSQSSASIVERLRDPEGKFASQYCKPHQIRALQKEAADEIERLQAELALYKQNYARKQLTDSERRALEDRK